MLNDIITFNLTYYFVKYRNMFSLMLLRVVSVQCIDNLRSSSRCYSWSLFMTTALVGGNYRPYDPVRDTRRLPSVWLQINYDCPKLRLLPTFTELLTLLRNILFSHVPFCFEKNWTVVMFIMTSNIYPSVYEDGWRGKGLVYWW